MSGVRYIDPMGITRWRKLPPQPSTLPRTTASPTPGRAPRKVSLVAEFLRLGFTLDQAADKARTTRKSILVAAYQRLKSDRGRDCPDAALIRETGLAENRPGGRPRKQVTPE